MILKSTTLAAGSALPASAHPDGLYFGPRNMSSATPADATLPGVLHRTLRAATRSDHVALDGLISRLNLASSSGYGTFLHVHHAALQSLEPNWREEDRKDFSALLCRANDDLNSLKFPIAALYLASRTPLPSSQQLGIAYVIRGSRLGASVLRQRVPVGRVSSYLDCAMTLAWPGFLKQLDDPSDLAGRASDEEVIRGARTAFELFTSLLSAATKT